MSTQNIETIKKVYDAFNARDYETVLSYFDPNFEWYAADNSPLADKSPYRGIDAIRTGVFDRIAAGFEKLVVVPDEIIAGEGDRVVVLGYYEGKFRGGSSEFRTQVAHIWTIQDGKPINFRQYVDTLKIALDSGSVAMKAATSN
jgi:ketosteroid isomerase-like protein